MTYMENDSDVGGYPVLEGHGRAASMPRLNTGIQVSQSLHITENAFLISSCKENRVDEVNADCSLSPYVAFINGQ